MVVIKEDIWACGVDEIMVRDRKDRGEIYKLLFPSEGRLRRRYRKGQYDINQINESCTVYRSKGTNVIIL